MKRLFLYLMLSISGALIGLSLAEFLGQRTGEVTIYLFISGLLLAVVSVWGLKKFAGIGFFSNRTHK